MLEVLNKSDGKGFKEEERLLLLTLAEEIAFAIRNAMVFEYVADTYCIQRQGFEYLQRLRAPAGAVDAVRQIPGGDGLRGRGVRASGGTPKMMHKRRLSA